MSGGNVERDYAAALAFLTSVAGQELVQHVSRGKSHRVGHVWEFESAGGVALATVDVHNSVAQVHAMPDLRDATTATVSTTRVQCDSCRQPKVLPGRAASGVHYRCGQCGRVCFVR